MVNHQAIYLELPKKTVIAKFYILEREKKYKSGHLLIESTSGNFYAHTYLHNWKYASVLYIFMYAHIYKMLKQCQCNRMFVIGQSLLLLSEDKRNLVFSFKARGIFASIQRIYFWHTKCSKSVWCSCLTDAGILAGTVVHSWSWTCNTRPDFSSYSVLFWAIAATLKGVSMPHTLEN